MNPPEIAVILERGIFSHDGSVHGGDAARLPLDAQRLQLLRHLRTDPHLRLRRRRVALFAFALVDTFLGNFECAGNRVRRRHAFLEERLAEERRVAAVAATERDAVRARGRDDDRVVVLQRLDVAARIARRYDDDPPLDAGVVQHLPQTRGGELDERERRLRRREMEVARTVAREVDHHHVVIGVDRAADLVQRLAQVRDRRERRRQERLRIVDEDDRPPLGAPLLVHYVACRLDVLAEHVLRAVGREADEVKIGDAGALVLELAEELIEQERLRGEYRLRARIDAVGLSARRVDEPGIVGRERRREPDRRCQQDAACERCRDAARAAGDLER